MHLHSTQSTTLRRAVTSAGESGRHRQPHTRRAQHTHSRRRSAVELQATGGRGQQSQRRRATNARPGSGSNHAAARIRSTQGEYALQHGKQSVFKAVAAAVGAQVAVLAQGLSAQPPAAITMDNRGQQLRGGSHGADSRRQHTGPEMASRAHHPSHRGRRPQVASRRCAYRNRHR